MRSFHFERERFKELILYVSQQCASAPKFGATKLNKILYFADFLAYAETGEPITGATYFALAAGPAPRALVPVREEMKAAGELAVQSVPLSDGRRLERPVNLREPRLEVFKPEQVAIVDRVIERLWEENAEGVSDLSHRMVGWQTTAQGDNIPYESIFFSNAPLTEAQQRRGIQVAERYARELASVKS
ncbi:MAG: Panacea domain-containing protein [Thermoanaerobaculia bacterium]